MEERKIEQIEAIINKGEEIELWDIKFPPKPMNEINSTLEVNTFELNGVLKDYVDIENEINEELGKGAVEIFIEKLEKLQGIGVDVTKIAQKDTIETLAKKSGKSKEEIEKIGLKLDLLSSS